GRRRNCVQPRSPAPEDPHRRFSHVVCRGDQLSAAATSALHRRELKFQRPRQSLGDGCSAAMMCWV
ncbi:MAG: hypothetical protein R5N76_06635, partial [Cutibacterium granulosum]|nr:hypothetical protein [Cutibacterium granulosum]